MPREDMRWFREADFQPFEPNRRLSRGANTLVVARVLEQHVPLADGTEILEIGSGLGEFYDLAPDDYKPHILQTERWPVIVEANRKRHPGARVEVADAYSLPFPDGRFDAVTGYSAFDTFLNPEAAFRECRRVTKEGGVIIGIQDLVPDLEAALTAVKEEEKVPFLTVDKGNPVLVTFGLQEFINYIEHHPQSGLFRRYMDDPYDMWREMERQLGGTGVDAFLSRFVSTVPLKSERIGAVDYYQQRIKGAMQRAGYHDVQSERKTETFYMSDTKLRPDEIPKEVRGKFDGLQVTNDAGVRTYERAGLLVPGRITTKSTLLVTVGRK